MKRIWLTVCLFVTVYSNCLYADSVLEETDYVQIILYGQSLGMGWESPRALSTTPVEGNYMLGNNVLMKYNDNSAVLIPMVANVWQNGGEQPIVSCVNTFSALYRANVNSYQKFTGMTGGEGGQTIERLSKECTNGGFYNTFTSILNNTLTALNGKGETVSCPAIIYMQGEYNCDNASWYRGRGLTSGSDGTTDKDTYKTLLLKLKNNLQSDIMMKYGQKQKPLFFIYQTSGNYIKKREMSISMAQVEFAEENSDVILLNPHYALPDYGGGHLSTNGYRWYGEITGNILYDVLVEEKNYQTLSPVDFSVDYRSIIIKYHVPGPPLVFDTYTTPKAENYGFTVYHNGTKIYIRDIAIKGDSVIITTMTNLTGKVEISYAGNPAKGTGNLRDSDNRASNYLYFDDSSDSKKESYVPKDASGNTLYGKPYPLYNWSIGFYYDLDKRTGSGISTQANSKSIETYPNPTTGRVYIPNYRAGSLVTVYSISGNLLAQARTACIDLSGWDAGYYILKNEGRAYQVIKLNP